MASWIIIYDPTIFVDPASGTRILSIVFGIICTLLAIVPAIFIKSKSTLNDDHLVPITSKNIGNSLIRAAPRRGGLRSADGKSLLPQNPRAGGAGRGPVWAGGGAGTGVAPLP